MPSRVCKAIWKPWTKIYKLGISHYADGRQIRVGILDETRTCNACNTSQMDTFCNHAISCSTTSDRIARHMDTGDLVFHACRSAGLFPVLEAKGLTESSRRRPRDIFILNWPFYSL